MPLDNHRQLEIGLLCIICDKNKREKVEKILGDDGAFFNLVTHGKGTANSKILNYLGLGETEKAVFFSILAVRTAQQMMESLNEQLQLSKPGNGILFLTRVQHGCYHKTVEFINETNGGTTMQQDSQHDLILVVLNRGYSEDVMDVARNSGARGGTVLHARSSGKAGMEKFFGVTIAPEKELLMILAQNAVSCGIMASIAEKAGPTTDAGAISFSLPVNRVMGIQTAKIE